MFMNETIALKYLCREFNYLKYILDYDKYIVYRDSFIVLLDLCHDVNLICEDTYSSYLDEILLLNSEFEGV